MNLLQDAFLLAYKGRAEYYEPLRIMRSLVLINTDQYVIWRTFQWHWEMLVELLGDDLNVLKHFQVSHTFRRQHVRRESEL